MLSPHTSKETPWLIALLAAIGLSFIIGALFGMSTVRRQAIDHGAAEWIDVTSPTGHEHRRFVWLP